MGQLEGQLEGKVALIVGSAAGIGARTAEVLAAAGARVVLGDIDVDAARAQAAAIVEAGGDAMGLWVDVTSEEAVAQLVRDAVERYGRLDILHNNAAATTLLERDVPVSQADPEVWRRTFEVNVLGCMLGCKHVLPHLVEAGGGSIVNTSSSAAFAGAMVRPAYAATKAAIATLSLYVATSYGKLGVRCNTVVPGTTLTARAQEGLGAEGYALRLRHHLTTRLGDPDDIAQMVLFLVSDASRHVTGQTLFVDGGYLAHQPHYADELEMISDPFSVTSGIPEAAWKPTA